MRVALVHEFLTQFGGAERVLQNLVKAFPDSVLHLIIYNGRKTAGIFNDIPKQTSFLDRVPFARSHHKLFLALMPKAVESFKFNDFDLVISDSSSFAKGAKSGNLLHICYCHTPTRFLWTESEDYLQSQPYPGVLKALARPVLSWMRKWDYRAAQRPHYYIANSVNVQNRIRKYYHRESEVIYPPVETEFFHPTIAKQGYFLVASRLEPYKKINLVLEAFNRLGLPLKVAGSGTGLEDLKKLAKPNIEFLGRVSDEKLRDLYSGATAFIFPAEEDAGIMMLEAQACGTPVIAYKAGGALEFVKENFSGAFFDKQTSEAIEQTVRGFKPESYRSEAMRQSVLQYDTKIFQAKIREFVSQKIAEFRGGAK